LSPEGHRVPYDSGGGHTYEKKRKKVRRKTEKTEKREEKKSRQQRGGRFFASFGGSDTSAREDEPFFAVNEFSEF